MRRTRFLFFIIADIRLKSVDQTWPIRDLSGRVDWCQQMVLEVGLSKEPGHEYQSTMFAELNGRKFEMIIRTSKFND